MILVTTDNGTTWLLLESGFRQRLHSAAAVTRFDAVLDRVAGVGAKDFQRATFEQAYP